jgi:hypothetical protein
MPPQLYGADAKEGQREEKYIHFLVSLKNEIYSISFLAKDLQKPDKTH